MSSAASASATPEFKEMLNQAIDLKNQERYAEAARILEQLRERYSQSASVHAILGDVLWQQNRAVQAIPAFQRAVELAPTSELASLGLFHTLLETGDKQRSMQEMNRFLSLSDSEEYEAIAEKWNLLPKRGREHTSALKKGDMVRRGENTKGDETMTPHVLVEKAMFHDDLMSDDDRARFHDAFRRFGDAVSACLGMFLWVLEEVRRAAYADGRDIHAVPLFLMFDFAEAIDSVSVLARSGAAKNCSQLLRTALEIQLSLKYMLEHKNTYEQRCLAYEYYHLQDQLRWEQRCDPASPIGKQLRAELAGDPFVDLFDVKGRDVATEARDLEARMNSPRYAAVRAEFARMKAAKIRDGGWYSLWDGPKNMRELSIRLMHGSQYEAFYRGWSCIGHGEGAIKRATGKKGDELQLSPLRSPERLPEMCRNACHLCNALTLVLVDGLVPHIREEMQQRYIRDIKPGLTFIDSVKGL